MEFAATRSCVSCGLCLPACPTYREYPVEMASPRGRLALISGLVDGHLPADEAMERHLGLCLNCRACETACPAHLPFGRTMEEARALLREKRPPPALTRFIERLTLGWAFKSRRRLGFFVHLANSFHLFGLSRLARFLPARLGRLAGMLPRVDGPGAVELPPEEPVRGRVAFLAGCVADYYLARTNQNTLAVLAANGFAVTIPRAAFCCGALHLHRGMAADARELALATITAFETEPGLPVVTNSAGCGSALKEYPALFAGDPATVARAEAFSKRVLDATEFLVRVGLRPPGPVPRSVAYDDPCHLLHGQGISSAPRALLAAIPELVVKPLPESDWCCGSAGIYSVTQVEMSLAILARKVAKIRELAPQTVLTANPGCLLHLRMGLASAGIPVAHVMDLLAEAYAARKRVA